jgi:mannitol-1-/sugar-/sorbitol-6-/2-deoxyglucose-6-phosphatase
MIQKTRNKIEAVIFDMDGVIIDSEEIWKKAEHEIFSSVGVKLTDEFCKITEAMTTREVTNFWFNKYPWKSKSLKEVENSVIEYVACLIKEEGKAIKGIEEFVKKLKAKGYRIGLATNSPSCLIPVVLEKLALDKYFDATSSAEHEMDGKPSPDVYLTTAEKLNIKPENCIAIEDSHSGIMAAKNAGMKTVILGAKKQNAETKEIADHTISSYNNFEFLS